MNSLANKVSRRFVALCRSLTQLIRIFFYRFISDASMQGRPILSQPLQTVGRGQIIFDGVVKIGFFPSPFFHTSYAYIEARNRGAKVVIGDGVHINNGFTAIAENTSITIGRQVLIGSNVEILDSDFHSIRVDENGRRKGGESHPVFIDNDVFIGSNVRILKGTTIGRGAVIANSSVIVNDIPPNVVAGGNPAKVLKDIA